MSVLPPMDIRYPYDPTGKSKTNYVAGEVRTLPPRLERIIVPAMGAFYANSLIVRHNTNELIRGVDYELAALYHDATIATGKDVNLMIVFINEEIVGDVELYYQVVGGHFTGVWESVQQYVNVLLVDPRKVRWDDVLDKPHFFVPKEHFHDINDIYGLNHIIPKLEEIRQAVLRIRSKEMRRLYDHFLKVKRDTEAITSQLGNMVAREVEKFGRNNDQITLLKQQVTSIRDRVTALENNTAVQAEIAKLKQKDIALTGSIDTLNSNLNGLTNTVNTHTAEINALKAKDVDYGTRITAVENKNIQQDTKLAELVTKNNEQDNAINNLRTNLTSSIAIDPNPKNWLSRTNNGLLALPKLSRESGNLLSIMPDGGIYYGIEPAPDIANIYVDAVLGNDTTGKGTKASPFQTLKKAVEFTDSVATRTIHLYEGQNHVADKLIIIKSHGLSIFPYGPRYDAIPKPATYGKDQTLEAYNLNTRITFIPQHRRSTANNLIGAHCILNNSGANCRLSISGIKLVVEKHPEDDIIGTPFPGNPSLKYSPSTIRSIISRQGKGINLIVVNSAYITPNDAKYKMPLIEGSTTYWGTYSVYLGLNEISGIFPLVNEFSSNGVWVIGNGAVGTITPTQLFSSNEIIKRYFPNISLDNNGLTRGMSVVGLPNRNINVKSGAYISNAAHFYSNVDTDNYENSSTVNRGSLTYHNDGKFTMNKPLYNSANQLLAISPDANNKLIARGNGLYVAPTQEISVSPDVNNIITMRANGLYATAPQNSGLDFTALNNLPEKTWVKGTTFLAKDISGNWHRVISPEDLFQDLGVTLTSDRYSANFEVGTTTHLDFTIKCTVTNSQVAKNAMTELTLTLPQHSAESPYEVLDYNHTLNNGDRVERVSDTLYRIYGLQKGGTCILTFKLRVRNFGSYQIGAQVSVNASVDTNSSNNTSNLTVVAVRSARLVEQPKEDVNYATSVDCPMIIASNADTGERYMMMTTTENGLSRDDNILRVNDLPIPNVNYAYDIVNKEYINNDTGYRTLRLKLENCSSYSIVYYPSNRNDGSAIYIRKDTNDNIVDFKYRYRVGPEKDGYVSINSYNNINSNTIDTGSWDHNTSILTLSYSTETAYIEIYCRPKGSNCKWQVIAFGKYIPVVYNTLKDGIIISGISSNSYTIDKTPLPKNSDIKNNISNNRYSLISYINGSSYSIPINRYIDNISALIIRNSNNSYNTLFRNITGDITPLYKPKITLNLNKNTTYNIEILFNPEYDRYISSIPIRSGNISIRAGQKTITISTTTAVSESDNILSEYLDIFFT